MKENSSSLDNQNLLSTNVPEIEYREKRLSTGSNASNTIKSGTIEKILDYICYEIADQTAIDNNSISVLFATYPSFTNSTNLLKMIQERLEYFL